MYRLYTEDTHPSRLLAILHRYFPGFTLFKARGSWQGHSEPSAVIEVEHASRSNVDAAAREIKHANHQQAVMVTRIPDKATFI